ncbi:MAG: cohesin domain-containing protein [Patescibacteria group bacterium]|nr:cohesin domain-containing protein [Patescibacteria group bacterium]
MRNTAVKINLQKITTLISAFLISFVCLPNLGVKAQTADASLYFSPVSTSVSLNGTVSVAIMVNTGGNSVNTVTADFTYPTDTLQIINIDSTNSEFSVEAEEDHTSGTVYITRATSGGDSYSGIGEVTTINFRGIAAGTATLTFTGDAVVMDADTSHDILGTASNGTLTVSSSSLPNTGLYDKPLFFLVITIALLFITLGFAGVAQYKEDLKIKRHN